MARSGSCVPTFPFRGGERKNKQACSPPPKKNPEFSSRYTVRVNLRNVVGQICFSAFMETNMHNVSLHQKRKEKEHSRKENEIMNVILVLLKRHKAFATLSLKGLITRSSFTVSATMLKCVLFSGEFTWGLFLSPSGAVFSPFVTTSFFRTRRWKKRILCQVLLGWSGGGRRVTGTRAVSLSLLLFMNILVYLHISECTLIHPIIIIIQMSILLASYTGITNMLMWDMWDMLYETK